MNNVKMRIWWCADNAPPKLSSLSFALKTMTEYYQSQMAAKEKIREIRANILSDNGGPLLVIVDAGTLLFNKKRVTPR